MNTININLVKKSLKETFNLEVENLLEIENEGYYNIVFSGTLKNQEVIIRVAQTKDSYPVEIWIYQKLKRLHLPVPEVLYYNPKGKHLNKPIMVMTKVSGQPLNKTSLSESQTKKIYQQAGKILKKVNSVKTTGYGEYILTGKNFQGKKHSWAEQLKHLWDKNEVDSLRSDKILTEDEFQVILDSYKKVKQEKVPNPTLLYYDLHGSHIFIEGEKITGVIDLGNAQSGDPRADIALSLFYIPFKYRKYFIKSYGKLSQDPLMKDYLIFICALKMGMRHMKKSPWLNEAKEIFLEEIKSLTSK